MAELYTVSGDVLLLDEEDVPLLQDQRLYTLRTRRLTYATYVVKTETGQTSVLAHRVIMRAQPGTQVDHRNGNGLDCRKANLRFADHSQNQANRRAESLGTSRFRGVTRLDDPLRYQVAIHGDRTSKLIGMFDSEEFAARAFDRFAHDAWGDYARLNFPGEPLVTLEEIASAKRTTVKGASRFRGVSWNRQKGRWLARLTIKGKGYHGGFHADEEAAARAYDQLALQVLGAAARLNFPQPRD